jgi:hypothetical protein
VRANIAKSAFTLPVFSMETSRLIFPFSSQRSSNWLSTSKPRRRSASKCRPQFGKLIAEDTEKWGKVIRGANIKAE